MVIEYHHEECYAVDATHSFLCGNRVQVLRTLCFFMVIQDYHEVCYALLVLRTLCSLTLGCASLRSSGADVHVRVDGDL